jgi:hypothetical protein
VGKLSAMPGFLVATRLQNLCGESNQLAQVLRDEDGKEAQIPGTKMLSRRAFLDTLVVHSRTVRPPKVEPD